MAGKGLNEYVDEGGERMEQSLFVGNGLNRCLDHSISWDCLLQELSVRLGVTYNRNITMPMEYERLINAYLAANPEQTDSIYLESKKQIAERLLSVKLPEQALHRQIAGLKLDAVITTNYDHLLEQVYHPDYKDAGDTKKYLPEATSVQNGVKFYHPHGIASRNYSLCLGFEHYMGIVERIRKDLNTRENNKADMMRIKQVLYGEKDQTDTWYERFYTSDLAIIGFGLTDCEADIWWLITHRAYLYYSNYCGFRTRLKNQIVYFDIINDMSAAGSEDEMWRIRTENEKYNRHILLSNEHVIVKKYYLSRYDGSYTAAYEAMLDHIRLYGVTG